MAKDELEAEAGGENSPEDQDKVTTPPPEPEVQDRTSKTLDGDVASGDNVNQEEVVLLNGEDGEAGTAPNEKPDSEGAKDTGKPTEDGDAAVGESETSPLREKTAEDEDVVEKVEGDEEEGLAPQTRTHGKLIVDTRCVLVGVMMLSVIIIGALAGILAHRLSHRRVKLSDITFAAYYSDGMVLQRGPRQAVIWGYGPADSADQTVTVTLEGTEEVTLTSESKIQNSVIGPIWRVVLDPVEEHGPFTVKARLAEQQYTIQLEDVMFGDVWFCAGEANMQLSVNMLPNATQEFEDAENFPNIRLFSVMPHSSHYPWYDLHGVQLPWSTPSKESLAGHRVPLGQFAAHFSGLCWLYGKQLQQQLGYPIGLVEITYNKSTVEAWMSNTALDACPQGESLQRPSESSVVWNGMVHPLINTTFKGVIWYQGESNSLVMSRNYNCTFPAMIQDWRRNFQNGTQGVMADDFPFGFVQLGPNREGDQYTYGFSDVRWQQTADYGYVPNAKLPQVFMASAIDLPEPESPYGRIHPRHKRLLAQRLAKAAHQAAYSPQSTAKFGLRPIAFSLQPDKTLMLRYETPIEVKTPNGFEVCCSDSKENFCQSSYITTILAPGREWVHTPILTNNSIELTISGGACGDRFVVGVRYGWRETPCEYLKCGVYEAETQWPALPYIHYRFYDDGVLHPLDTNQEHLL